jgi:hypothetical protein
MTISKAFMPRHKKTHLWLLKSDVNEHFRVQRYCWRWGCGLFGKLRNHRITQKSISFLWYFSKCDFQRPSKDGCYEWTVNFKIVLQTWGALSTEGSQRKCIFTLIIREREWGGWCIQTLLWTDSLPICSCETHCMFFHMVPLFCPHEYRTKSMVLSSRSVQISNAGRRIPV